MPEMSNLLNNTPLLMEARIHGVFQGQAIMNTLYFMNFMTDKTAWSNNAAAYLQGAANQVKNLWDVHVTPILPEAYDMDEIRMQTYGQFQSDLAFWQPVLAQSVVREFTGVGGQVVGDSKGPAPAVTFRVDVNPVSLQYFGLVPRRGYLAIGPTPEAHIGADGRLSSASNWFGSVKGLYDNAAALLLQPMNLSALNGNSSFSGNWIPVRVKRSKLTIGGVTVLAFNGWSPNVSVSYNDVVTFRRSRLPEA